MKATIGFLLAVVWLGGCQAHYLAMVNGEPIDDADLRQAFTDRHGGHKVFLDGVAETRRFLDTVIEERLLIQEAYRMDLQDRKEIREAVDLYAAQKATDYLVKLEITKPVEIPAAEIRQVYDTRLAENLRVRQVVCETQAEAEAIRAQLVAGGDFEAIAREKSIGRSKIYGRAALPGLGGHGSRLEAVAFALKDNELSPVFKGPEGYEILRVEERKAIEKPEFAKVEGKIKQILQQRIQAQRSRAFYEALWRSTGAASRKIDHRRAHGRGPAHAGASCTTVVEVDVTKVARLRARAKNDFKAREASTSRSCRSSSSPRSRRSRPTRRSTACSRATRSRTTGTRTSASRPTPSAVCSCRSSVTRAT